MKLCLVSVVLMLIITRNKGMADDYMCTYPVSHDREAPQWELFHIDDGFIRDDNATNETCWDYCNKAENCRSAQLIIHGDGRHYCYRYNISVQELKDTRRYSEIFTQTDGVEYPTYITYDKDCAECTYPVSHEWVWPFKGMHSIDMKRDDNATAKTCQAWCNEDVTCRSVMYHIVDDKRECEKFSISVQELKNLGRYIEIHKSDIQLKITYDKQCADPPSIMCSNTYPVSHAWESPNTNYFIDQMSGNSITAKTCQDWCNEDVHCRSVMYEILVFENYCVKNSIAVQELKDSGRYNEIFSYPIKSAITYDKQCFDYTSTMCSNIYPVSHDREYPAWYYHINEMYDDNATFKTCQDWCNKDVKCRSVTYSVHFGGSRRCDKYRIRVQKLKDLGKYNFIYTNSDTDEYPTYITYDRDCVEVSPTTKGPGTDGDEVSPATKGPDTNAAAIGETMIVLILMIGAGAVFVAPMLPGAEVAF